VRPRVRNAYAGVHSRRRGELAWVEAHVWDNYAHRQLSLGRFGSPKEGAIAFDLASLLTRDTCRNMPRAAYAAVEPDIARARMRLGNDARGYPRAVRAAVRDLLRNLRVEDFVETPEAPMTPDAAREPALVWDKAPRAAPYAELI